MGQNENPHSGPQFCFSFPFAILFLLATEGNTGPAVCSSETNRPKPFVAHPRYFCLVDSSTNLPEVVPETVSPSCTAENATTGGRRLATGCDLTSAQDGKTREMG